MTAPFSTFGAFSACLATLPAADGAARDAARARDAVLTKPPGALGRLEEVAIWAAGWRGERPRAERAQVIVFAGNHGVTAQGISAFPAEVTAQMVANFETGGAAINQLCKVAGADLSVVPLDLEHPTADFTTAPAMGEEECLAALNAGWDAVSPDYDVLVVGEMGIGNTTSAAALAAARFGGTGADWAGAGTGLDAAGQARKAAVIDAGLARHPGTSGVRALAALGGRELAAMAGAIVRARELRIPVLLDGFICSAAAACLTAEAPDALDHCLAAHLSHEGGHAKLLKAMDLTPLLSLDLRLGEGSGAALALPIYRAALACHSDMASFADAGVAEKS
ncbi:MAG: nicotinate-nucleotide--dimethylbenzimidazole phosphoribosyltransferase [Pseudomonadota bacterium]